MYLHMANMNLPKTLLPAQRVIDRMRVETVTNLDTLLRTLEAMATENNMSSFVFRGHQNSDWRLESTFDRYSSTRLPEIRVEAFEHLIKQFAARLTQIDDDRLITERRRGRLEYARHCGVPSPLIDFTRSPYVALWFAFNGVRGTMRADEHVAILALNWNMMGVGFQRLCEAHNWSSWIRDKFGRPPMDVFRWEIPEFFDEGYFPILKFIPFAASWNSKMQRQQGCFVYDGLNYGELGAQSFEELISDNDCFQFPDNEVLTKFLVPCSLAREVFQKLDLTGISGAYLYGDASGVAADVYNTFNYQSRFASWDVS